MERYRLHDLLDEYATPKLKGSGKYSETKALVAGWLVELFDTHFTEDVSNAPHVALERDNLLHACEWARGEKKADILASLITKARNWFYVYFSDAWVQWFAWLDVQQFRKETNAALASYEEALKLFRQVGAKLGEANVLMSLGDFNLAQERWSDAIIYYEQTLPIYQKIQAQLGQANTLIDLGKAYFEIGEHEKGMGYVKEAGDIFARIGSGWAIKAYRRLAEMLKRSDRVEEAKQIEDQ